MESQSRYSIVEKLEILDRKNMLSSNIKADEQKLANKELELQNWEKDIAEDVPRTKRVKQQEIDRLKSDIKNEKELMTDKQKHFDSQIDELDKALEAIQLISKDAPTPQEQT